MTGTKKGTAKLDQLASPDVVTGNASATPEESAANAIVSPEASESETPPTAPDLTAATEGQTPPVSPAPVEAPGDNNASDADRRFAAIRAEAGLPAGVLDLLAPFRLGAPPGGAAIEWLTFYATRYEETKNPLFVWEAMNVALTSGVPMPDWVTDYFYRVSNEMHAMSRWTIPEKDLAPAVYRALEFVSSVRGANPFRAITDAAHDFAIAYDVWRRLRDGHQLDYALDDAAREHPPACSLTPACGSISRSTVQRLWYEHRHNFPTP